ncbi:MAG: restriction endonuclease subunit S [Curvibacter sp.]|jgi:type I restriction enzyme S subunit
MKSEVECVLGDIAELVRGVSYKPEALLDGSVADAVALLRATNIGVRCLELKDVLYVPSKLVKAEQYLRKFDVVIAMSSGSRTAVGRLAQLRSNWVGTFGAFCGVIRPHHDRVDPEFLGYVLYSPDFRARIDTYAAGTAIMNLSREHLMGFSLSLPSRAEQRSIAELLGRLDDRIDLLRQINTTLESIAQALFKSWFIDFDPVRAKAEGREPEGMDAATAALCPAEFEESTLGLIPKGWRVGTLAALCESIFSGGTPATRKPEYWMGELRWFASGETRNSIVIDTEKRISPEAVANSSTRLARPGDILIASAGQGLTRGQTSYCAIETYINQSVVSVRTSVTAGHPAWTFYNLSRRYEEMRGLSDSHSIRGSLTTKLLAEMPIICPPLELMKCFGEVAGKMLEAQANNQRRLATLANLRDGLLPRLISGQLRLPEAQEQLEDALA